MSASARVQMAAISPKLGRTNADTALNSPILGRAASCRGKPPAIGWLQSCFEHHPYPLSGMIYKLLKFLNI